MDLVAPRLFLAVFSTVIVLVVLSKLLRLGGRSFGTTLVLRQFHYSEQPTDGCYAEIVGRPQGILGWLLTTIGLDSTWTFKVTDNDISVVSAGLTGRTRQVVPLTAIGSTDCGYTKSPMALYLGVAAILYGLYEGLIEQASIAFVMALIVGAVLLAIYWFSKRIFLRAESTGGSWCGLQFKQGAIEFVAVDFDKVADVVRLIERLILAAQRGKSLAPQSAGAAAATAASASRPTPPPTPQRLQCPKCRAPIQPGSTFCESCGERLNV